MVASVLLRIADVHACRPLRAHVEAAVAASPAVHAKLAELAPGSLPELARPAGTATPPSAPATPLFMAEELADAMAGLLHGLEKRLLQPYRQSGEPFCPPPSPPSPLLLSLPLPPFPLLLPLSWRPRAELRLHHSSCCCAVRCGLVVSGTCSDAMRAPRRTCVCSHVYVGGRASHILHACNFVHVACAALRCACVLV